MLTVPEVEESHTPKTSNSCHDYQNYGHAKKYCGYPRRPDCCWVNQLLANYFHSTDSSPKGGLG